MSILKTKHLFTKKYQYFILLLYFNSSFSQKTTSFVNDDFILVPITINETLSGNMIFDTGSNHTIVYQKLFNFNKKAKIKESTITDFYGNTDKIIYSKVKKITIGNQTLNNVKIRFNDLNNIHTYKK